MRINKRPEDIFQEYEQGRGYNEEIGLYETVRQNENFFIGRQWEGLNAPDLDKPVLNFIKRVVNHFISVIVTDAVGVRVHGGGEDPRKQAVCSVLEREAKFAIERNKLVAGNRDFLRSCAVDGDACAYLYYKDGEVAIEPVENTRVLFGDRYSADVQAQPYIILVQPMLVEQAQDLARRNGADPEAIRADYAEQAFSDTPDGGDRVTVLVKFWKDEQTGRVHFTKVTRDCVLQGETDLQYDLYPIAYMSWEKVKNSYHGQAAITGLIPNQIAVNKLWAMALHHQHTMAFPKIFYDRTKVREWSNRVGEAIGVVGNPNEAVAGDFRAADMSSQLIDIVDRTIVMTKEFMGASDAALGNVRPDNTSAILAVQKASTAPLELQKLAFYQFIEDMVHITVEIVMRDFPPVAVKTVDALGMAHTELVDLGVMDRKALDISVDVGAGSYWSELTQLQTLNDLFAKGIITDAKLYLESLPEGYVRNKSELIKRLEQVQPAKEDGKGGEKDEMPLV